MNHNKLIILCYFDGTIVKNECTELLLDAFGLKGWQAIGEKYVSGEISHSKMNQQFTQSICASEEAVLHLLKKKVKVRTGFFDFIQLLKSKEIPIIIISCGWDLYIHAILKNLKTVTLTSLNEITSYITDFNHVPVISNTVTVDSNNKWEMNFPWSENSCALASPCKAFYIDHLKSKNYTIISIGNSESDICMLREADLVFATGSLPQILDEENIPHLKFETFTELIPQILNCINSK